MAVKRAQKAAEAEERKQVVKDTGEQKKEESGADIKATEGEETAAAGRTEKEKLTLVYIGPSLPAGQLKSNKIFIGTMEEIEKELEAVMQKYPLVKKMLVPVEKVAEKKDKARTAGNILNKYYSDIASGIAANEAKEG